MDVNAPWDIIDLRRGAPHRALWGTGVHTKDLPKVGSSAQPMDCEIISLSDEIWRSEKPKALSKVGFVPYLHSVLFVCVVHFGE